MKERERQREGRRQAETGLAAVFDVRFFLARLHGGFVEARDLFILCSVGSSAGKSLSKNK